MTPDEIQKDREAGTPLTVEILADALSCFWNAALGAAHNQQAGFDAASIMAEGVGAIANRLAEYSKEHLTLTAENAALKARVAELGAALAGMLSHSCVADAGADMKCEEDHTAERKARAALEKRHD